MYSYQEVRIVLYSMWYRPKKRNKTNRNFSALCMHISYLTLADSYHLNYAKYYTSILILNNYASLSLTFCTVFFILFFNLHLLKFLSSVTLVQLINFLHGTSSFVLTHLLCFIHAYSMEQSPFLEANQFSASQEIPRILWKQKFHYRIPYAHLNFPYRIVGESTSF